MFSCFGGDSAFSNPFNSWNDELGSELLSKDGPIQTTAALNSAKRIGLYFSASWCPPCQAFTPVLSALYDELKDNAPDSLEIVFISSDNDENSFLQYFGKMPWYSLPFDSRKKQQLSSKYAVFGIPKLVILTAEGQISCPDARSAVSQFHGDVPAILQEWPCAAPTDKTEQRFDGCVANTVKLGLPGHVLEVTFAEREEKPVGVQSVRIDNHEVIFEFQDMGGDRQFITFLDTTQQKYVLTRCLLQNEKGTTVPMYSIILKQL
jgi:nucleoredoxin